MTKLSQCPVQNFTVYIPQLVALGEKEIPTFG